MTINPATDLAQEFPEYKDKIHTLKMSNTHFAGMLKTYHEVIKQIHRIEQEIETVSDSFAEEQKKQRLKLKDALLQVIREAA